jgi:hypothetical protein
MAAMDGHWNNGGVSGFPHHAMAARYSDDFEPERFQRADYFVAINRGIA